MTVMVLVLVTGHAVVASIYNCHFPLQTLCSLSLTASISAGHGTFNW